MYRHARRRIDGSAEAAYADRFAFKLRGNDWSVFVSAHSNTFCHATKGILDPTSLAVPIAPIDRE